MKHIITYILTLVVTTVTSVAIKPGTTDGPLAHTKNGTYKGIVSQPYDQDFFLGVPFAKPPVGNLRFRNPQSTTGKWSGTRSAQEYAPECVAYVVCTCFTKEFRFILTFRIQSNRPYNISEDCLYLNVVRPSNIDYGNTTLPVAVWIHGGGFYMGGSSGDQRFNLSFIVQHSVEIGLPIIAVSVNYRLGGLGFLSSREVSESGSSNMGLRDQRLGLQWIQENIAGFGGDPSKVTIWGESAGAASVGLHLTAYNGRDDGLFRGAIMESGNPIFYGKQNRSKVFQNSYDALSAITKCNTTADSLECLRSLPLGELNNALNTSAMATAWYPQIDGDIIHRHSSEQIADGAFVHVPIILGANSDEGTAFAIKGINTTQDFLDVLTKGPKGPTGMPEAFAEKVLSSYPVNSSQNVLAFLGPDFVAPPYPFGKEWRRAATYWGDQVFIANRRLCCETWAKAGVDAYCYRFNAVSALTDALNGVTHFTEVAFMMLDLGGYGYPPIQPSPFQGLGDEYKDLARLMNGDWISFVATQNPNTWHAQRSSAAQTLGMAVPEWPRYQVGRGKSDQMTVIPEIFVYNANYSSAAENDTFRQEGINLINSGNLKIYDR